MRPPLATAGNAALPLLPLLFIALLLAEIAGFALVGSLAGVLATVLLAIATSVLGAALLRIQGLGALARIRETMEAGASPGRDLVHGLMIAIAGLLLVIPGFVTDILGLMLFIPPLRELVWRFLKARIVVVDAAVGAGFRRSGPTTIDLDEEDFSRREPPPARRLPEKDD